MFYIYLTEPFQEQEDDALILGPDFALVESTFNENCIQNLFPCMEDFAFNFDRYNQHSQQIKVPALAEAKMKYALLLASTRTSNYHSKSSRKVEGNNGH